MMTMRWKYLVSTHENIDGLESIKASPHVVCVLGIHVDGMIFASFHVQ